MKVVWEFYPNPEMAGVNLTREVPDVRWEHGRIRRTCFAGHDSQSEPDVAGAQLAAALIAIPGITAFGYWNRYSLHIMKGGAFSWSEIRPAVEGVLAQFYGEPITSGGMPQREPEPWDDEDEHETEPAVAGATE